MIKYSPLIMIASISFLLGCGLQNDTPVVNAAPPNDFVKSIVVERVYGDDTATLLADETEIVVNTGFIVQFEMIPSDAIPSEYHARTVTPPDKWSADVVFFPRGKTSADVTELKGNCPIFSRKTGPSRSPTDIVINSWYSSFWALCGFSETVVPKVIASEGSRSRWQENGDPWFWSYFCVSKDQVGEFVYEIRVYPTAAWKSKVRAELGEPVVLKRGLLRVVPVQDEE